MTALLRNEADMIAVSKEEARALGLLRYFTGTSCKHGHIEERQTSTGICFGCNKMWKRIYRSRNPEKYRAECRAKIAKDPQLNRDRVKAWQIANPDRMRESKKASVRNRRARLRQVEGRHGPDDVRKLIKEQRGRCAYCRTKIKPGAHHVDHIVSLARGGTNWPHNLQITCSNCNCSKSDTDPIVFAQKRGMLL